MMNLIKVQSADKERMGRGGKERGIREARMETEGGGSAYFGVSGCPRS